MHEGQDPEERERETLREPSLLVSDRNDSERIGRKTDGRSRDCRTKTDRERGPSAQESHERPIGLSQIDIIPSRMREDGSQFSVDHGTTESKKCSDEPQEENQ